jgi:predicted  nucleic acid-binding Zn-ribbon protein
LTAISFAADSADLMAEIAALRRQNEELLARLERQQRQIDALARRIAEPAPAAPQHRSPPRRQNR